MSNKKKYTRTVKCPHCENQIDRNIEPFTQHSGRYYHEGCYNARHAKTSDRNNLIDYICYLYKINKPSGFMLRQIKTFEESGYSLKGIQMTLQYFHEIKENPIINDPKVGIGIIEYVYDDAREYFRNISEVINHNSKIKIDNKEEVVYVKPPKNTRKKLIDLEDIL